MTEKFKILANYIKDMSSETRDLETYMLVKERIPNYQFNIDINSKAIRDKMVEINVTIRFTDKEPGVKKSYYEIVYATIVKIDESIKEKKDLEKIILCDVPNEIYPHLENSFLNLVHNSGHPEIKLEKKIDFNKLYSEKFN